MEETVTVAIVSVTVERRTYRYLRLLTMRVRVSQAYGRVGGGNHPRKEF